MSSGTKVIDPFASEAFQRWLLRSAWRSPTAGIVHGRFSIGATNPKRGGGSLGDPPGLIAFAMLTAGFEKAVHWIDINLPTELLPKLGDFTRLIVSFLPVRSCIKCGRSFLGVTIIGCGALPLVGIPNLERSCWRSWHF
jgi:hypothetical protein